MDIDHEHEVIEAFFARGVTWVAAESAQVTTQLSSSTAPSDDFIEELLFHANGPASLEEIICRATVNELNALIEAGLQEVLTRISGSILIGDKKLVIGAKRDELEKALSSHGIQVADLDEYYKVLQIKEIAEGFKHRQGFRPLPKWSKSAQTLEYQSSCVPDFKHETIHGYEVGTQEVRDYLRSAKVFLDALRKKRGRDRIKN